VYKSWGGWLEQPRLFFLFFFAIVWKISLLIAFAVIVRNISYQEAEKIAMKIIVERFTVA
jgi:hypothetical protein